jgi:BASS family bile acid:Na+ symporter
MNNLLTKVIVFLGKKASYTLPIGVAIGLLYPALSSYLKPFLVFTLLVPLTLALVRIETNELIGSLKDWKVIILLTAWVLIGSPIFIWFILSFVNIEQPIFMAAVIAAAAPPVTACAAIAIFLRINAAIAVVITVTTMLVVPFTLPLVLEHLIDLEINTALWKLSLSLSGFILTTFTLAFIIKKSFTATLIKESKFILDGVSVVFISLFTIGIMDGINELFHQNPQFVIETLIVSTFVVFILYCFSTLIFWRLGARTAISIGLCSGSFNLGLMYIVLEKHASLELLIFFGIGQIPMYCLPSLFTPIVQKLLKKDRP